MIDVSDKQLIEILKTELKIDKDGNKFWFLNGIQHRVDGPAVIRADGFQAWLLNGRRHRIDGPAIITATGRQMWFINDIEYYSEEEFNQITQKVAIQDSE